MEIGDIYIHVVFCRIGDVGGQAIAKALLTNNVLQNINLSCNELTEPTAAILSQVLISNTSLKSIILAHNKIGQVSDFAVGYASLRKLKWETTPKM